MKIELWKYSFTGKIDNWGTIRGLLGSIGNSWGLLETIGELEESIVSRDRGGSRYTHRVYLLLNNIRHRVSGGSREV